MSEIRVDAIKTRAGAVPKAVDVGLNITGTVLQVVGESFNANESTTSSSYVSSNITVSITPSSTSSKILTICSPAIRVYNNSSADATGHFALSRNSGSSYLYEARIRCYDYGNSGALLDESATKMFLDSPSTTSSLTYTMYIKKVAGVQMDINSSTDFVSTLTLMEIAG